MIMFLTLRKAVLNMLIMLIPLGFFLTGDIVGMVTHHVEIMVEALSIFLPPAQHTN